MVGGIVARTLWFTHRSIFLVALNGLLVEEDREQLAARLRAAANRAYDQLAGGLGEYGKRARDTQPSRRHGTQRSVGRQCRAGATQRDAARRAKRKSRWGARCCVEANATVAVSSRSAIRRSRLN